MAPCEEALAPRVPSSQLQACNGYDIVKTGRQRKNRFLFQLPGLFMAKGSGQIGTVVKMNTSRPTLYIDVGEDRRLRLRGRIAPSTRSYVALRVQNKSLACKDVFDQIVVFEKPELVDASDAVVDEARDDGAESADNFEYGLSEGAADVKKRKTKKTQAKRKREEEEETDDDDDEEEEEDDDVEVVPPPSKRPRRSTVSKVNSYKDAFDDEEEENDDDDDDDDVEEDQPTKKKKTTTTTTKDADDGGAEGEEESQEEEEYPAAMAGENDDDSDMGGAIFHMFDDDT